MSYCEKKITLSSVITILVLVGYCVIMSRYYFDGAYQESDAIEFTGKSLLLLIFSNAMLNGLVLSSFHNLRKSKTSERGLMDERDLSIELKGMKTAYLTFGMGFLISIGLLAFGGEPAIIFNLIALSIIVSELTGNAHKLVIYRRYY